MPKLRTLAALVLLSGLTGCGKYLLDRVAPETVGMAENDVNFLRAHQYEQIEPLLDPSIDRSSLKANFDQMAATIPAGNPLSIKTVGASGTCTTGKGCTTIVNLEYQFPSNWLFVELTVNRKDSATTITSFRVRRMEQSIEEQNRLTLAHKEPLQYVLLASALGSALLVLYAMLVCIRTPIMRRKWLWFLLTIVGLSRVWVDWTTGEVDYHIAWIHIPPASIWQDTYGPWSVSVSIPLGALIVLIYCAHLRSSLSASAGATVHPDVLSISTPPAVLDAEPEQAAPPAEKL